MEDLGGRQAKRKAKKQRKKEERKAQAHAQTQEHPQICKRKASQIESAEDEVVPSTQPGLNGKRSKADSNMNGVHPPKKPEGASANLVTDIDSSEVQSGIVWSLPDPRPPLSVKDVRYFLMHGLGAGDAPTWASLGHHGSVDRAIVLLADSLGHVSFNRRKESFNFLSSLDQHCAPIRVPGSKTEVFPLIAELLTCPASKQKKAQKKGKKHADSTKTDEWLMQPSDLLLTRAELAANNFPGYGEDWTPEAMQGFIKANERADREDWPARSHQMVAMDCEMCLTEEGQELTRISLVDEDGIVLYDQLVKPTNAIVDYKTKYSGVTAELLRDVTTTLADVQTQLLSLIDADTILVGHSLENDLKACRLRHAHVIDTSVAFPHVKGFPFKNSLNFLATKFLRRALDRSDGHCSVQDAHVTLQLVKLKLSRGPTFGLMGDSSLGGESLFRVLERAAIPCSCTLVVERGGGGGKALVVGSAAEVVTCTDNSEIEEAVTRTAHFETEERVQRLVVARFERHLSGEEGKEAETMGQKESVEAAEVENSGENKRRDGRAADQQVWVKEVDERVGRVCRAVPSGTLVVVLGAGEDLSEVSDMRARRRASMVGRTAGLPWAEKDEKLLMAKVDAARTGIGFFFLTDRQGKL